MGWQLKCTQKSGYMKPVGTEAPVLPDRSRFDAVNAFHVTTCFGVSTELMYHYLFYLSTFMELKVVSSFSLFSIILHEHFCALNNL